MNVVAALMGSLRVERTAWTLIHFIWEGAAIAAIYTVVRSRMPGGSSGPRARYILACAALGAMAAAPLLTWYSISQPMERISSGVSQGLLSRVPAPVGLVLSDLNLYRTTPASPGRHLLSWVVAVWFAGSMAFLIRLMGGWVVAIRLRTTLARSGPLEWCERFDRLCARVALPRSFRLLISPLVNVPMVIGWLRPVVLVPVGFLTGLPSDQVEAVLLHELAHIRRNDYLVNVLQGVAEALLFYHPAVWWISGHIRAERELCCDDIAVCAGGDTFTYARALAELALSGRFRLNTTLAANGGSIADRIARLLGRSQVAAPGSSNAAIVVTAIVIAGSCFALFPALHAQEQPDWQIAAGGKMAFEVASIKPAEAFRMPNFPLTPDKSYSLTGGRLSGAVQLTVYIQFAYKLRLTPEQVGAMTAHLPRWVSYDFFEIDAKAAGNPTKDQMRLMMQSLLVDRFGLKVHFEKQEEPVLALRLVRNGRAGPGLRLHPSDAACDDFGDPAPLRDSASAPFPAACYVFQIRPAANGTRELGARNVALAEFAEVLPIVDRSLGWPVVDRTRLDGKYDVLVKWTPESNSPAPTDRPDSEPAGPNFREALSEQMGMKLESGRDWVQTLVIDHVERPSAN